MVKNLIVDLETGNETTKVVVSEHKDNGEFETIETYRTIANHNHEIIQDLQEKYNDYEIEFYANGDSLDLEQVEQDYFINN
jgi:hypothetical protein